MNEKLLEEIRDASQMCWELEQILERLRHQGVGVEQNLVAARAKLKDKQAELALALKGGKP